MCAFRNPAGILFTGSLTALLLAGCVDQIDADLPAPPRQLVLNSIFTPDSLFRVQVSRVTGTLDTSARVLSGARVYLLQSGQAPELLQSQGRGLYFTSRKPRSGGAYGLRAEADDYPAVQAADTIPEAVPIREAWYTYPTATDQNNELHGTIVLRFDDPGATTNFYEISCYQDPMQGDGIALDARGNAALAAEDDAGFNPPSLVFSDRLFNGQRFELRAAFQPVAYGTQNGVPMLSKDLHLVLRSVSRAYYQYRKSWSRHLYNQGIKGNAGDTGNLNQLLFLGDPSAMYSNVQDGYGVVVGYAKSTIILRR